MSRGLPLFALIAVLTTPMIALAESAEALSASLAEQREPGVIDPVDAPPDDLGSIAANPAFHVLTIDLTVSIIDEWAADSRHSPTAILVPAESVSWPSPGRERRLSWLQTLLI